MSLQKPLVKICDIKDSNTQGKLIIILNYLIEKTNLFPHLKEQFGFHCAEQVERAVLKLFDEGLLRIGLDRQGVWLEVYDYPTDEYQIIEGQY